MYLFLRGGGFYKQNLGKDIRTMKNILSALLIVLFTSASYAEEKNTGLYQHLQDISVTVKSGSGEGSGVIFTRSIPTTGKPATVKVNFVWTAAHVIDGLRSVRTVIKDGRTTKVIEFKDAQIVQELVEDGRRVGEMKMEAKVIKYSDSENGEDLALLMIRKKGFIDKSTVFYTKDKPVSIGTELYHVGSLLGQTGSNSMTRGICSQVGRVLDLGTGDGVVFDQTTVTAFPGSSGGGVFLSERSGENAGRYVGMLVRGAGETFNLIVPVRRMRDYAREEGILWAIDSNSPPPTLKEVMSLSIEGGSTDKKTGKSILTRDSIKFPTLPRMEHKDAKKD